MREGNEVILNVSLDQWVGTCCTGDEFFIDDSLVTLATTAVTEEVFDYHDVTNNRPIRTCNSLKILLHLHQNNT